MHPPSGLIRQGIRQVVRSVIPPSRPQRISPGATTTDAVAPVHEAAKEGLQLLIVGHVGHSGRRCGRASTAGFIIVAACRTDFAVFGALLWMGG